jgi:sugar phosphate isomerase/epimerase
VNRRHFLRTAAASSLAVGLPRAVAALDPANPYRKNIGIQLYTLRNELAADTPGTLKAVAEAGYQQVELYGFPDCDPLLKAAADHGLAVHSSHFNWDAVVSPSDEAMSDFRKILDKAKEHGLSHLVIPYLHDHQRRSLEDYQSVAGNASKAAVLAKEGGIRLSYHNHAFEFELKDGGRSGFEVLVDECSPDVHFELDVFWVKLGGIDPVELIGRLAGRVSQLHLKDLAEGVPVPSFGGIPQEAFKELGGGTIPMEPLLVAAAAAGVVHCHVEQDHSPEPLESIRRSIRHLGTL